jgi:release factor glutamine methyltransferase
MEHVLLSDIAEQLKPVSDTPALDASVLLAHIVGKPRTWVVAHPEMILTPEQQEQMEASLRRLAGGEAFPYVLGHWEFFGLDFDVTPDVLIPRPETETLVEEAITWLQRHPGRSRVADVGTGSGAIAIAIALHVPSVHILATDISADALRVAKQNAEKHRVSRQIEFVECDLLPARSLHDDRRSTLDLLCANLPYIPTDTLHHLAVFGREPSIALDGGPDGLDLYRRLFARAPEWMATGGKLLLEIESTQGAKIQALTKDTFGTARLHLHRDLAGRDRLLDITLLDDEN